MATKQSHYFKGNARTPVPQPHRKGEVLAFMFKHTFTEELATGDVLDLFPLVPYGRVIGFEFASVNVGTPALDIGFMTGTPGSLEARTVGDELIDGVAANATTGNVTGLAALAAIAQNGDAKVSIGVSTATTIAADPTKELHVRIWVVS